MLTDTQLDIYQVQLTDGFRLLTGALYTLIGYKDKNMLTKHDWTTMNKVWPSILLSRHSEKPSVAKLIDMLFKHLQKHSETFALENNITDKALCIILSHF